MSKVSIAMFSTFKRPGWKSEVLEQIVPILRARDLLVKGYGIKGPIKRLRLGREISCSFIPLGALMLTKLFEKFLPIPGYMHHLVGDYIFGMLVVDRVRRDNSNILYCKPRPLSLVKAGKKSNKKILMEFGEMHPLYTSSRLASDYAEFGINSPYIFTSSYGVRQSCQAIELADRIVVLSNESKKSFINQGVPPEKLSVIGLGGNVRINKQFIDGLPFAFISTAFHSFVKGTHRLLLAWREAGITKHPLIIVGELQSDIQDFIELYGPFQNVQFVGHQNIGDFYQRYNAIGILNSLSEGWPRSVFEYMQHGFPVIVSPVATCDLVEDGVQGFIVSNQNELVAKLKYFSSNIDEIKKMGASAKVLADSLPSSSYGLKLVELIEEM